MFIYCNIRQPPLAIIDGNSLNNDRPSFSGEGMKTLSLNIHNLIYSIIIYYSTPPGLDRGWEKTWRAVDGE